MWGRCAKPRAVGSFSRGLLRRLGSGRVPRRERTVASFSNAWFSRRMAVAWGWSVVRFPVESAPAVDDQAAGQYRILHSPSHGHENAYQTGIEHQGTRRKERPETEQGAAGRQPQQGHRQFAPHGTDQCLPGVFADCLVRREIGHFPQRVQIDRLLRSHGPGRHLDRPPTPGSAGKGRRRLRRLVRCGGSGRGARWLARVGPRRLLCGLCVTGAGRVAAHAGQQAGHVLVDRLFLACSVGVRSGRSRLGLPRRLRRRNWRLLVGFLLGE